MFNYHWYQLALWSIVPSMLLTLTMLFMPESPSWYVNHIKDTTVGIEQALTSLRRLRTPDSDINNELNELIESANRISASKNQYVMGQNVHMIYDIYSYKKNFLFLIENFASHWPH